MVWVWEVCWRKYGLIQNDGGNIMLQDGLTLHKEEEM